MKETAQSEDEQGEHAKQAGLIPDEEKCIMNVPCWDLIRNNSFEVKALS